MTERLFQPSCYFCIDVETDEPEPVRHVTFKSGHDGFLCQEHLERADGLNQLTMVRLVQTGIDRILKEYGEAA